MLPQSRRPTTAAVLGASDEVGVGSMTRDEVATRSASGDEVVAGSIAGDEVGLGSALELGFRTDPP